MVIGTIDAAIELNGIVKCPGCDRMQSVEYGPLDEAELQHE